MLEFYTAPKSIGFASHVALEESGLDFKLNVLDMSKQQQTDPAYTTINPKARVPSLIIEGYVLTETPAILIYIAQLAPNSTLALPSQLSLFNCSCRSCTQDAWKTLGRRRALP